MTDKDKDKVVDTDTVKDKEVVDQVIEPNLHEEQARDQGWVSKEEWEEAGRPVDEWRPAKEFVERGELFKSIHQVKRELKQEKAAREVLQKHHQYVFERAYQKAVKDLRDEKRKAMRDEDFDKVEAVEEEMEQLQKDHTQAKQALVSEQKVAQDTQGGIHPEFQEWVSRNNWYNTDTDMREFSEAVGMIYMQKNPSASPAEVLKHVESKVRKQYSEKFGVRKAAPNAVSGVDRTSQRTPNSKDVYLDEMETQIMKKLVFNGDLTEEQYKQDIKKAREADPYYNRKG